MEQAVAAFVLVGLALGLLWKLLDVEDRRLLHRERQAETRASVDRAAYQPAYPMLHTLHVQAAEIERKALPAPAPGVAEGPPPALVVPSVRALLDQGLLAVGRPLPVWTARGPLLLTSKQIWTAGIAGRSGSGKTRTAALLIGYEALHGADLLVIDPHRHKDDSLSHLIAPLAALLLLPPALTDPEVEAVLTRAETELAARRAGRKRGRLLLVIDEYTSYQRRGGPLAARMARVVEEYATEGRGYECQALVIGQNWKASRSGGTEVREVMTSALVHRSWKRQAAYLCPDDETAEQAESLVPGRAIFVPADDDPVEVGIPLTERADLARIALLRKAASPVSEAASPVSPARFTVLRPETEGGILEAVSETASIDPAKRAVVLAALQTKEDYGDIICRIWQVKPGGGKAYKDACAEMRAILTELAS